MDDPNDLLTAEEFALLTRRSVRTVHRELASGTGCRATRLGRRILFRRSDIQKYLEANPYSSAWAPHSPQGSGEGGQ
jgi:excisionase family DNA binding protein